MNEEQFFVSTDKAKLDTALIVDFLQNRSYWAKKRTQAIIQKSIEHSICFGVYTSEGKQVGFARVATDFAVFAWLMDVFVLEEYRGKSLGKLLMNEVLNHPDFSDVSRWGLATMDAHGLYKQYGFTELTYPDRMMERVVWF
jgi:GNAT superfamily N-acetyltransferase